VAQIEDSAPEMTTRLRQGLYFGYQRLNGRSLGTLYRTFRREDRARLATEQLPDTLRAILLHASRSVPLYEEHLRGREGAIEDDPVSVLQSLPVLTKQTIRDEFDRLRSVDAPERGLRIETSGGSTGEPVRLLQDRDFQDRTGAVKLLYSNWTGWELGEPELTIWGSEEEILQAQGSRRARASNLLLRRRAVNAFRMSEDSMRRCLEELNRDPPRLIVAYVQSLDDLAGFAEEEGIEVASQRAIISTAGTLQRHMRDRIERVFGCRPFDRYGSREVGDIAGECGHHRGLHVFPWTNFVEIIDEDDRPAEPGSEGRILVTSLANHAMPLLRYEIGDLGMSFPAGESPCPCGRLGQRLAGLLGRTVDTFKAPDGSLINGEYFTHLLYFKDFVGRFQVVQLSTSRVVYRIVATRPAPPEDLSEIVEGTRAVMGAGCEVEFEFLEEIPPSASGKYRYTISEL
jgi:phenylacetate-CoA ligase